MVFLIEIILCILLAARSFAFPTQNNDIDVLEARAVCRSSINADFNDLEAVVPNRVQITIPASGEVQIVPTPYKHLSWNNGFRFADSPNSFSSPNRAFSSVASEALAGPQISITGSVQYFNLKHVYVACYLSVAGAVQSPIDCTITATGTKISGQLVSAAFKYTAGPMMNFTLPSIFSELESVLFQRSGGSVGAVATYTAYDDVVYDVFKAC